MTLPSTFTSIGDFAAYYSSMTTVYCKAKTVPYAAKAIFADQATVYVPQEAVDNYKAHKI